MKHGDRVLRDLGRWVDRQKHQPVPPPESKSKLPDDYDLVEHMRMGSAYKYDPARIARVRQEARNGK